MVGSTKNKNYYLCLWDKNEEIYQSTKRECTLLSIFEVLLLLTSCDDMVHYCNHLGVTASRTEKEPVKVGLFIIAPL